MSRAVMQREADTFDKDLDERSGIRASRPLILEDLIRVGAVGVQIPLRVKAQEVRC